jgi:UDP-N-acetylmuramate--alanine ligase
MKQLLENKKPFHFIGIGGIGMSALAHILLQKKIAVSGSEKAPGYLIDALKSQGATIYTSHQKEHLPEEACVVYSSAIGADNAEYAAAVQSKAAMIHRSQLLALLAEEKKLLAVSGTHGKTTTTALLSWVLSCADLDPSYAIGGVVAQLKTHGRSGSGPYFVAEADESDGTFLRYHPDAAIVTNIDSDHMDHFHTMEKLTEAFALFGSQVKEEKLLYWSGDDPLLQQIFSGKGVSFGFSPECDWQITGYRHQGWRSYFSLRHKGKDYCDIELAQIGQHNAMNAAAVFALATALQIDEKTIRGAFSTFSGVKRRVEKKSETCRIIVIDDYAHHPEAVAKTLEAIRYAIGERRLIVAFQPHRYSRTQSTLGLWGNVFHSADHLFLTEIYAASEQNVFNIKSEAIADEISANSIVPYTLTSREHLAKDMAAFVRPFDVIVSMGAGNITSLSDELEAIWKKNPPKPIRVGVISGGESGEHEVALTSAKHFLEGLDQPHFSAELFAITKKGNWLYGPSAEAAYAGKDYEDNGDKISQKVVDALQQCDLLLPVLHGPKGEDGAIQGFFELLGKPYIGCDMRSAAICMDKGLVKRIALGEKVPTLPFLECSKYRWQCHSGAFLKEVMEQLTFPLFVKPSHCGSSLGVTKVLREEDLQRAIQEAFSHDTLLIVEQAAPAPFREIEFSVLGNEVIRVFSPGEILSEGRVYDYASKYGSNGFATTCQPEGLEEKEIAEGKKLAEKIYRACRCKGLTRVDFFYSKGSWWLNELNPMPGFTPISLYPQLCATQGLPIHPLMDELATLALHRPIAFSPQGEAPMSSK